MQSDTHIYYNDSAFEAGCIRFCKNVSRLLPVSVNQRSVIDDEGEGKKLHIQPK